MAKISEQPQILAIDYTTEVLGVQDGVTVRIPVALLGSREAILFTGLQEVPSTFAGAAGQTVKVNRSETSLEFSPARFTELIDTQATLTGQANKYVVVNSNETGLIFSSTGGNGAAELKPPALLVPLYQQFGGF